VCPRKGVDPVNPREGNIGADNRQSSRRACGQHQERCLTKTTHRKVMFSADLYGIKV